MIPKSEILECSEYKVKSKFRKEKNCERKNT